MKLHDVPRRDGGRARSAGKTRPRTEGTKTNGRDLRDPCTDTKCPFPYCPAASIDTIIVAGCYVRFRRVSTRLCSRTFFRDPVKPRDVLWRVGFSGHVISAFQTRRPENRTRTHARARGADGREATTTLVSRVSRALCPSLTRSLSLSLSLYLSRSVPPLVVSIVTIGCAREYIMRASA